MDSTAEIFDSDTTTLTVTVTLLFTLYWPIKDLIDQSFHCLQISKSKHSIKQKICSDFVVISQKKRPRPKWLRAVFKAMFGL